MTFGSLFSGIGGIDLGLERAGMECRWQMEIDPFCQKVLAKHWPEVKRFGDIRTVRTDELEPVDCLAGGYPCQPFSQAGKRGGAADPRHLWPEFGRLIRALRPRVVFLENVPGHLSLGFGSVLGDLAGLGYDAEWICLRAADFGASHLRKRVFVVAYNPQLIGWWKSLGIPRSAISSGAGTMCAAEDMAHGPAGGWRISRESPEFGRRFTYGNDQALENPGCAGFGRPTEPARLNGSRSPVHDSGTGGTLADSSDGQLQEPRRGPEERSGVGSAGEILPDATKPGLEIGECQRSDSEQERETIERNSRSFPEFAPGPSPDPRWPDILAEYPWLAPALESPVRGMADGFPDWLDRALSDRTKRLRALGNAVVPQVAEFVGRRIMEALRTANGIPLHPTDSRRR